MFSYPLEHSKKVIKRKVNKSLASLFDANFNQLNHPIKCQVRDVRSFINRPVIKWPLKSIEGQPFFYAYLNEETKQIEVYDDSILLLLNYLGNYGNCYFLDNLIGDRFRKFKNRMRNDTPTQPSFTNHLSNPSNLFELNQETYRHNLHIDSLSKSFKKFGILNTNKLINKLYSTNTYANSEFQSDRSKVQSSETIDESTFNEQQDRLIKKKLNSFEDTFVKVKKSFNQNFIDREEYILKFDLEEAFFLKHVFGNLSVQVFDQDIRDDRSERDKRTDRSDKANEKVPRTDEMLVDENQRIKCSNLNLIKLWLKCIELCESSNQCFITKYAAYFYFRSKGFIVKNGIKFGSDFVLYNRNPSLVHSTYSITLIKRANESDDQILKLINIQAFVRMTKCVVKVPVLCIVKFPANLTRHELQTPDVIRRLQIKCLLMERWISSVERDPQ